MHHCFAQTKWAVRKYGERIHDLANRQFVCHTCHSGCGSKIKRFTEQEFLEATKGVTNEL
jgi:hypothetical protein